MTKLLMRFRECFEVHLIRWRPAHLELEDETDEELNQQTVVYRPFLLIGRLARHLSGGRSVAWEAR
jgi:hypothetical protein